MNSKILIAIGVGTVLVIAAFVTFGNRSVREEQSTRTFAPQTSEENGVTVLVTPRLMPGSATWDFEVTMDTHSVELDDDLVRTAVLVDERGNEYAPISWEGDPPGGHHRTGTLSFPKIDPLPAAVTLRMRDVGNVPERTFFWALQ